MVELIKARLRRAPCPRPMLVQHVLGKGCWPDVSELQTFFEAAITCSVSIREQAVRKALIARPGTRHTGSKVAIVRPKRLPRLTLKLLGWETTSEEEGNPEHCGNNEE